MSAIPPLLLRREPLFQDAPGQQGPPSGARAQQAGPLPQGPEPDPLDQVMKTAKAAREFVGIGKAELDVLERQMNLGMEPTTGADVFSEQFASLEAEMEAARDPVRGLSPVVRDQFLRTSEVRDKIQGEILRMFEGEPGERPIDEKTLTINNPAGLEGLAIGGLLNAVGAIFGASPGTDIFGVRENEQRTQQLFNQLSQISPILGDSLRGLTQRVNQNIGLANMNLQRIRMQAGLAQEEEARLQERTRMASEAALARLGIRDEELTRQLQMIRAAGSGSSGATKEQKERAQKLARFTRAMLEPVKAGVHPDTREAGLTSGGTFGPVPRQGEGQPGIIGLGTRLFDLYEAMHSDVSEGQFQATLASFVDAVQAAEAEYPGFTETLAEDIREVKDTLLQSESLSPFHLQTETERDIAREAMFHLFDQLNEFQQLVDRVANFDERERELAGQGRGKKKQGEAQEKPEAQQASGEGKPEAQQEPREKRSRKSLLERQAAGFTFGGEVDRRRSLLGGSSTRTSRNLPPPAAKPIDVGAVASEVSEGVLRDVAFPLRLIEILGPGADDTDRATAVAVAQRRALLEELRRGPTAREVLENIRRTHARGPDDRLTEEQRRQIMAEAQQLMTQGVDPGVLLESLAGEQGGGK